MKDLKFEGTSFNVAHLLPMGKEKAIAEIVASHWMDRDLPTRQKLAAAAWDEMQPKKEEKVANPK